MEKFSHYLLFRYKLIRSRFGKTVGRINRLLLFLLSLSVVVMMLVELGYPLTQSTKAFFREFYNISFVLISFLGIQSFMIDNPSLKDMSRGGKINLIIQLFIAGFALFYYIFQRIISDISWLSFIEKRHLIYLFLFLLALFQLSGAALRFINSKFEPARIFAGSFIVFILIGSWLLILPNSLLRPISYIEALFTATSSVCITGLSVVNISSTFTSTGLFIMVVLMQIGALGVLTFTTLFGMLAMGKTSFRADVLIRDMLNQNNFNEIFRMMRLIFFTTLSIEIIGAFWLYEAAGDPVRFPFRTAVFHSVSAFCNAGFSTLPEGLATPWINHNWAFLFAISVIVIIGSIGFPIVNNIRYGLTHMIYNLFTRFGLKRPVIHRASLFTINTKIAVWMTIILLSTGTLFFYFSEYNGILKDLSYTGKWTTAFFMAMTPRSGGFNCYPMLAMTQLSVLFTMGLMWIGGGPLSTGGGIKTTTFGLAILNIWCIMRGQTNVDMYNRRIDQSSLIRAGALIFISIVLTFIGTFLISWFDPEISLRNIIFDVLSAISTCGLSMDTTPLLSDPSRIVLIVFMFCGRVGLLIILESLVKNSDAKDYRYPTDYVAVG
ncbi:MAG: potassium transporter TrkG [Bacteroidales bacterium]